MRLLFIEPGTSRLQVEYLSAFLKREGHDVRGFLDPLFFDDMNIQSSRIAEVLSPRVELVDSIEKNPPRLLCFSVVSDHYRWATDLASFLKTRFDIPIVFGGIHPTSVPRRVLENNSVDYVIVGEGEGALSDLVSCLERGEDISNIPNLGFRRDGEIRVNPPRPLIEDLDTLPTPDKELLYSDRRSHSKGIYTTRATRGCPFRCSYCCHSFLAKLYEGKGKYYRRQSVDHFMKELVAAKKRYNPRVFIFHDDTLTTDRRWFREFTSRYAREVARPYFCWCSPPNVDEEIVDLLVSSGCINVEIGINGALGTYADGIAARGRFERSISRALELLRKTSIFVVGDYIIGLPGQNADEIQEVTKFLVRHPADHINITWNRYYPRTAAVTEAVKMGLLSQEDVERIEKCESLPNYTQAPPGTEPTTLRHVNLLGMTPLLPRSIVLRWLEKKSRLRWIPKCYLGMPLVVANMIRARLRGGKRRVFFVRTPREWLFTYLRELVRYVFRVAGKRKKRPGFDTKEQPAHN